MIAGYILTGGKNTRMNGNKKLFLTFHGIPFYEYILQAFHILPKIYLSVEAEDPYKTLHIPMVTDIYPDIGPIGGIYSGLRTCPEDALFVTACDMPLIDHHIVSKVLNAYEKHPDTITIIKTGERIHPLFGIYPKTVLPLLVQMIRKKDYKVKNLFSHTDISVIELEQKEVMENINTRKEYEQLEHMVRQKDGTEMESF